MRCWRAAKWVLEVQQGRDRVGDYFIGKAGLGAWVVGWGLEFTGLVN